jgi:hypothetical protein
MKPRDKKVLKDEPKVRLAGEKGSEQNKLRSELYRYAHERLEEASEQGMLFEVIALCDMLITDRIEAYCQYLLHDEDMQFPTESGHQAINFLGVGLKDNANEVRLFVEWKELEKRLRSFFDGRNFALHSFVLLKNAVKDSSLEERVHFVEIMAEDGIKLVREVDSFVKNKIKL